MHYKQYFSIFLVQKQYDQKYDRFCYTCRKDCKNLKLSPINKT